MENLGNLLFDPFIPLGPGADGDILQALSLSDVDHALPAAVWVTYPCSG